MIHCRHGGLEVEHVDKSTGGPIFLEFGFISVIHPCRRMGCTVEFGWQDGLRFQPVGPFVAFGSFSAQNYLLGAIEDNRVGGICAVKVSSVFSLDKRTLT